MHGGAGSITAMSATDQPAPGVSVILPVRNEERHLRQAVAQVLAQEYPGPYEVVLAIGPSEDRTAEIAAEIAAADPRVVVVDNPSGRTPAALNRAVAAARHDVLVRVDGHSEIRAGYVADAVRILLDSGAANVGGMMLPVGVTPFEQAVARAMSHPLGIGAEKFHTGGAAGPAPTVYLGVFRREALEDVGGFDEHFVRAQDWELNLRLRKAGHVVWFDPSLGVTYRPRGTWRALARQFFATGQWRRQVVRTYPETANPRYLAPPTAVLGVVGGLALTAVRLLGGPRWTAVGALAPLAYATLVAVGSALAARGLPRPARLRLPAVIATMHMAWGAGFLRGVAHGLSGAAHGQVYPGAAQGGPTVAERSPHTAHHRPED